VILVELGDRAFEAEFAACDLQALDEFAGAHAGAGWRDLLDYANRFHHDTNPAWETETINDRQLIHFCERTLKFTRKS
jgi:hypothetical protein